MYARLSKPVDCLTVGALRAALAELSDDVPVIAHDGGDPSVGIFEATYEVTGVGFDDGVDTPDDARTSGRFAVLTLST